MKGQGVVEGRNGNVAAVENLGPRRVRIYARTVVEGAVGGLAGGGLTN